MRLTAHILFKHRKQKRENSLAGYKPSKPTPVMPCLQQGSPPKGSATFPKGAINWGSSVQIHEPLGDSFHSIDHKVDLEKFPPNLGRFPATTYSNPLPAPFCIFLFFLDSSNVCVVIMLRGRDTRVAGSP